MDEDNARSHGAVLRAAQELMAIRRDPSPTFSANNNELHVLIRKTILVVKDAMAHMRIPATKPHAGSIA